MPSTNPTFIPASEAARAKEIADIVRKVADTLSEKNQMHDYLMLVATFLDHFEPTPEPEPSPLPVKPSRDKTLEERASEFAAEHFKIADEKYPDMSWMQSFHVETAQILQELVSKANFCNAIHDPWRQRKERALRLANDLELVSQAMPAIVGRSVVANVSTLLREFYHELDEWAPPAPTPSAKPESKAVHFDEINKASHYNQHPSGVECIQITRHMNNNLGNVVKYIWRSGLKDGVPLKDLKKAAYYLNDEIAMRSKGKS